MATGRVPTTANSPLTAKGDLFTYSTAPARLAVSDDGSTLVADSATSTGLRWQSPKTVNLVTNGNFDIWQRGTSFTSAQASYTADRWASTMNATGTNTTVTQDTSVPNVNSKFSIKYQQVSTGATSVIEYAARQRFEQSNCYPLFGKSAVLSFWYRSNKTGTHGARIYAGFNTGGGDQTASFTVNAADTWEYKTISVTAFSTVSAPSVAATGEGALVDIGFKVGAGGPGFTTLSTNDYFQLSQVQLEVGSVATPFARAGGTLQGETALCQRYYFRATADNLYSAFGYAIASTTTAVNIYVKLPVTMRTAPTAVDFSNIGLTDSAAMFTLSGIGLGNQNSRDLAAFGATSTGMTSQRPYTLTANNSTSGYIGFSAEL